MQKYKHIATISLSAFHVASILKNLIYCVYAQILENDWLVVSLRASFSLWKRQIRFQTKMEDLSVEVYGENGAYYKVCKSWSTLEFYLKRVIFISGLHIQLYRAIVFQFCHILTKIFFREDHRGWNGRHVRLTGREFSMCFISFASIIIGVIVKLNWSIKCLKSMRALSYVWPRKLIYF